MLICLHYGLRQVQPKQDFWMMKKNSGNQADLTKAKYTLKYLATEP